MNHWCGLYELRSRPQDKHYFHFCRLAEIRIGALRLSSQTQWMMCRRIWSKSHYSSVDEKQGRIINIKIKAIHESQVASTAVASIKVVTVAGRVTLRLMRPVRALVVTP